MRPVPPTDRQLDRRAVLRFGALAGLSVPLFAACGSSSGSPKAGGATSAGAGSAGASTGGAPATTGAADFGALDYRLSWIKNVEFGGSYLADSLGFYKQEGFSSVNLIAGGPTATPQETDVVTGKAIVAISAPDITGAAVAKGAPLVIIGAQYQKNPFAMMSLTSKPIKTPQDMIGKKIGVQATNESVWAAFLKANSIDARSITKVPVQFDPLPLTQNVVDGWFSFITNEPNDLRSKGFDVTTFLLADFNYPLVSETYTVKKETLASKRDMLKAFLRAEAKGWKAAIADPMKAADLAANTYGKGLGLKAEEQVLEAKSQNDLLLNADTMKNGLFTITPDLVTANVKTLKAGGLEIDASLFDTSLVDEIYKDDPSLI